MQLSEDAQGILQPRRHFCDLSKRENLLPSAMLGSNTNCTVELLKPCVSCAVELGMMFCSASPQGRLMVDGCTDHHILHVIILLCPQLTRHVIEKCLFLIFFKKREQRCLASPAVPTTLVFCPGGIDCTSCFEENASY